MLLAAGLCACGKSSSPLLSSKSTEPGAAAAASCPAQAAAPTPLPGVAAQERTAEAWIARQTRPDEVVLDADDIRALNLAWQARDRAHPNEDALTWADLRAPIDAAALAAEVNARLTYIHTRVEKGEYLLIDGKKADPAPFSSSALPKLVAPEHGGELLRAQSPVPIRCGPTATGLYKAGDLDEAFDRNLCSTLRAGEPVAIIADAGSMWLARSWGTIGWIAKDAPLSPVPADQAEAVAHGPQEPRPLTRRALLQEAFKLLGAPYGWGGRHGGRDCSMFVADVLGAFGLQLPRSSAQEAQAGSFSIDLGAVPAEQDRLALIDAAAERGVVLLGLPGHIMLYLGRSKEGAPMAIHAFSDYLQTCAPGGETRMRVDRVEVSDLSLGEGSSRRSLLQRLTRIAVFGRSPGWALAGVAVRRPAAPLSDPAPACQAHAGEPAMFVTPLVPNPEQPLRIIAASETDLGSVALTIDGPGGRVVPPLHATGGPPWGYFSELSAPAPGRYTARLGDGQRVLGCAELTVKDEPPRRRLPSGTAWTPRNKWSVGLEMFYGVFVEQLFAYPFDDRTWTDLQSLLSERDHNLLWGHFSEDEEKDLLLNPDCADLPYFLRAYFAWKMQLPFAYRHCNRGEQGRAPFCDKEIGSANTERASGTTDVAEFQSFARTNLANGVHSGNGRAGPADSNTDYYPVGLSRGSLMPGGVFADPYGHGYVIAGWIPQGVATRGMLIGADAQPDGTIGRRRFWRGTFLFTPDTREAGAGFKRFRPIAFRRGRIVSVDNAHVGSAWPGLPPFSLEQYQLGKDGWYDAVEALVNPRPLRVEDALEVLLTALYEQIKARVLSIKNGQDYMQGRRAALDMPAGHSLFETNGPWEDYSTPSRDMRLLIALDTVLSFPETVKRQPARFGLPREAAALDAEVQKLRARIDQRLGELPFDYPRSDGSRWKLTAKDVAARQKALEVGYNPNDCAEIRWGAPEGSEEAATCNRRAPKEQQALMEKNRRWFATRTRPAR